MVDYSILYPAIESRRSFLTFRQEGISESETDALVDFLSELEAPVPDIDWNFDTLPYLEMVKLCTKEPGVKAPNYLVLRAERKNFSLQNCGYLGELAVLYLTARGIATAWQGTAKIQAGNDYQGSLPFVTCIAYGYSDEPFRTADSPAQRKPYDKVCYNRIPEYTPIFEAARLTPSSFNRQPWAFVSDDRQRLHLFRKKGLLENPVITFDQCVDCGAALAHMELAAKHEGFTTAFQRLKPEPSFKRGLVYQISMEAVKA